MVTNATRTSALGRYRALEKTARAWGDELERQWQSGLHELAHGFEFQESDDEQEPAVLSVARGNISRKAFTPS